MTKLFYYLAVDLCLFKWILPVFIVNDNNLKIDLFPWQIFSCLFNDFYSFCIFSLHCLELVIGLVGSFDFPAAAALAPDSIWDFKQSAYTFAHLEPMEQVSFLCTLHRVTLNDKVCLCLRKWNGKWISLHKIMFYYFYAPINNSCALVSESEAANWYIEIKCCHCHKAVVPFVWVPHFGKLCHKEMIPWQTYYLV